MGSQSSMKTVQGMKSHSQLGWIKVIPSNNNNNNKQFKIQVHKQVAFDEYKQWQINYNTLNKTTLNQTIFLPQSHSFQSIGLCSSMGHLNLIFDEFLFIFKDQIHNRKRIEKKFDETQIWYLMFHLVQAANYFEIRNQKIGDVNPHKILLNDKGQMKIISVYSMPLQITNYQKIVQSKLAQAYLAPQELDQECIEKGQYPKVNPCQAQVFSIGLTILQAGTLHDCYSIYLQRPLRINTNRLNDIFLEFRNNFSPSLSKIVASMININAKDRMSARNIYQILSPYEYEIIDLTPFQFRKIPQQLQPSTTKKNNNSQSQQFLQQSKFRYH